MKSAEGKNSALAYSESIEPRKTSRTDKKREYLEKKKKKRDRKNNAPAIGDNANAIEIGEKNKRDNQGDGKCYNC